MFPLRRHIAIQSECEIDCQLCQSIGCLHPHQRDIDEFRTELAHAVFSLAQAIVFPPNALSHPDIETMATLVFERGLTPIFRTKPKQFQSGVLDVILRLAEAGANFELLMDKPSRPEILDRITALKKSHLRSLTPVLIPTRRKDLDIVLDAIPFELRRELEILPLVNYANSDYFLESDELNAWLEEARSKDPSFRLKSYEEFDRTHPNAPPGFNQPGDFDVLFTNRRNESEIQLSIVIPVSSLDRPFKEMVASITRQTAKSSDFELVFVKDGPDSDNAFAAELRALVTTEKLNWSLLRLSRSHSDEFPLRTGLAKNTGALFGAGVQVAFLESNLVLESDWIQEAIASSAPGPIAYLPRLSPTKSQVSDAIPTQEIPHELAILDPPPQQHSSDWRKMRKACLTMPMKAYFEAGGFPRLFLGNSLENVALAWKLDRLGKPIVLRDSGLYRFTEQDDGFSHQSGWKNQVASFSKIKRLSTASAGLYSMTMDNEIYRCYFIGMGGSPLIRTFIRSFSKNAFFRPLLSIMDFVFTAAQSANPLEFLISSAMASSHKFIMTLSEMGKRRAK